MPAKAGFLYFKEVPINHSDDGALNLYQMKVLVGESSGSAGADVHCEGHCLSTFNDLWFQGYDADGSTIVDLDYWIESISGATPNQLATVWVEQHYIPAHPANGTCWMSYGKAGAAAASNGVNTWAFFENWENTRNANWVDGGKLAAGDWEYSSTSPIEGTYSLHFKTGRTDSGFDIMLYKGAAFGDFRFLIFLKYMTVDDGSGIVFRATGVIDVAGWPYGYSVSCPYTGYSFADMYKDVGNQLDHNASTSEAGIHRIETLCYGALATIKLQKVDGSAWCTDLTTTDATYSSGYVGIIAPEYNTGRNPKYDKMCVGAYTTNEPTWGAWGSEICSLPHTECYVQLLAQ